MPKQSRPAEFWLEQIVRLAARLSGYCSGLTKAEFTENPMAVDAASWCISCIGEAAGRILELDAEFDDRAPLAELRFAYAARNKYVHGYFDLDIEQIWDTAVVSVPKLAARARQLLDG